jgi:hypothetical protein
MSVIGTQLSDYINVSHVRHSNSRSRLGRLAILLALVSRWKVRQAKVPTWVATLSRGIVHNVCVSAVVPSRSLVLSHETKTLNEDKTLN